LTNITSENRSVQSGHVSFVCVR